MVLDQQPRALPRFAHLGAEIRALFYTRTLPWFAWPALPLALWSGWRLGGKDSKRPSSAAGACVIVMLAVSALRLPRVRQYALRSWCPLSGACGGLRRT